MIERNSIRQYFESRFSGSVISITLLDDVQEPLNHEMITKGYGYGASLLVHYRVNHRERKAVLKTLRQDEFGHDYSSDRAQSLLRSYAAFDTLDKHQRALDVGFINSIGDLHSAAEATEFFLITEYVPGKLYASQLQQLFLRPELLPLERERARQLARYLAQIHSVRSSEQALCLRSIRDLIGHGECIMGVVDHYAQYSSLISESALQKIEGKTLAGDGD